MKSAAHDVDVAKNSDDLRKMERLPAFGPRKLRVLSCFKLFLSCFSPSEASEVDETGSVEPAPLRSKG